MSSAGRPPLPAPVPTFLVSLQPWKNGTGVPGPETQARGRERGAGEQPLRRRGRSAHLLRVGPLSSRKGEPAASAALTLGGRRTTVPLKRRRPADRGETRVRPSGPASSLPGARAPRRVCKGGGVAWGRELVQTSKFGNASLSGVNSGLWRHPYPQPPKDGERRWGIGREAGSERREKGGRGSGTRPRGVTAPGPRTVPSWGQGPTPPRRGRGRISGREGVKPGGLDAPRRSWLRPPAAVRATV